MARVCSQCNMYDAAGTLEACPSCQAPMRFTLLPPPRQNAAPLTFSEHQAPAGPRRSAVSAGGTSLSELLVLAFRYRKLAGLVIIPFVLVCSFFGVKIGTGESFKSRYDQVRVGMDVDEVEDLLNPPRFYRGRFRMPRHNILDCVPDEGPYTVHYSESGSGSITLDFRDGVLVAKSQQGVK